MQKIKVLVVDDSAFMRKYISDMITSDPQFEIIDTARNGQEAIEKVKSLNPDVITMDIEMPVMNGLDALKIMMDKHPVPVIMLSSFTEKGARETILALELGAFDFIQKPSGTISFDIHKVGEYLVERLRAAIGSKAGRRQITPPPVPKAPVTKQIIQEKPTFTNRATTTSPIPKYEPKTLNLKNVKTEVIRETAATVVPTFKATPKMESIHPMKKTSFDQIVAIGSSTGGPRALKEVLTGLPEDFPAPIVIVQHMPANFTKSLAQRLDTFCQIHVVEAGDGEQLQPGTAYIAPGGWHMTIRKEAKGKYVTHLEKTELRNGHRPSVDILYESLLDMKELERHIVLLTGMGSDGAKGMKALFDHGVKSTFAENEESCVVFGMPRSAIELKCVQHILPVQEIAPKLVDVVK
ncbi:hypothetical protein BVG16_14300 [Paenibacillus selenitireducens]|uniref:Protein-glutamate methylesterase/protein-glutamine glutaminase n=1 Tax=Paenibacillus selenitireducens TaxID=1324314 RepID=A0A1T2XDB6_9BACL|nr:chemotaxis response regulator protein-glutamate methylesterase [Paenibacillus selenitireducens]OPA77613.1 hypothetical protein BVG16_14300 [Paenibacillus selenitireducens]